MMLADDCSPASSILAVICGCSDLEVRCVGEVAANAIMHCVLDEGAEAGCRRRHREDCCSPVLTVRRARLTASVGLHVGLLPVRHCCCGSICEE